MPAPISEDDIEKALLEKLLTDYKIDQLNCFTANSDDINDGSGRAKKTDVLLVEQLKKALPVLNQHIPEDQRDDVIRRTIDKLTAPSEDSLININRQMDSWIRDGIPELSFTNAQGHTESCSVYLIDFKHPENNAFLAVSQLWIKSQGADATASYRRPDVILYVNGLPLVFIELKNSNVKLKTAYTQNLADYINDIPQLFYFNAFCILSNALNTKVGAFGSDWDYFFDWLRVHDEKEKVNRKAIEASGTSLEYAIEGLCEPSKLLDYVENFIVYQNELSKIIAQSHQLLGVNRAFNRFKNRDDYPEEERSKLGVFWHTQGSGKSYSMVFYMRKIHRKLNGNFRFLVVTDRKDLDTQIYKNFLATATIKAKDAVMPKNGEQLKEYLTQNKRIVFTLIHKFHSPKGKTFPVLSEADDWIVMVDEAHRTQYKGLAENMRKALPNANYIAFTGTPLLGKQRKTHKWFGEYISEYGFQQAMDDGATLPLFYQKRVPSVQINNDNLDEEFLELLEDDDLTAAQREKLEKKYATELSVIRGDDRLEVIARDIVYHFPRRGYRGKAMMICVDKFTAVKMYNKVQYHWKEAKKDLQKRIKKTDDELEKRRLDHILSYMKTVDMAVVVSHDASDEARFQQKGLDIKPHAKRMAETDKNGWDIEDQFKAPEHELQLVFVCAMWLTGFDVPTVSTLYLDKPMKDHTLMQAIARANRVSSYTVMGVSGRPVEKKNGEVIDYYNVFRNMKKALSDYGVGDDEEESPIQDKSQLFVLLEEAVEATQSFCLSHDVDLSLVLSEHAETAFKQVGLFSRFADHLFEYDNTYKTFYVFQNTVESLYEACRPEINQPRYHSLRQQAAVIQYMRKVLSVLIDDVDIEKYELAIESLLDESIFVDEDAKEKMAAEKAGIYTHSIIKKGKEWNLQRIDFEKLKDEFEKAEYKNIEISDLRHFLERKIQQMLKENSERKGFSDRLRAIIDRYNSGATSTDEYMDELIDISKDLSEEEERHIRMGLTEDELELFDLLKKDKLTKADEEAVKLAAKMLIPSLKEAAPKVLLERWYQDRQNTERVRNRISDFLNETLPPSYDTEVFREKCEATLSLVTDLAKAHRKWAA